MACRSGRVHLLTSHVRFSLADRTVDSERIQNARGRAVQCTPPTSILTDKLLYRTDLTMPKSQHSNVESLVERSKALRVNKPTSYNRMANGALERHRRQGHHGIDTASGEAYVAYSNASPQLIAS